MARNTMRIASKIEQPDGLLNRSTKRISYLFAEHPACEF